MKRLLLITILITSTQSFANIKHNTCIVEKINETTETISKEDLILTLRNKGYQVEDDIELNSGSVPENGLSVSLSVGLANRNRAIGRNVVTNLIANAFNSTQENRYLGHIIINTSVHNDNKYVSKFAQLYSDNSFKGNTDAEENSQLIDEAYDLLDSVPSCLKINNN